MGDAAGIPGFEDAVEIGRDRDGVVYRGHRTGADGELAVRVLAGAQDAAVISRFERERSSIVAFVHPAVVAVHGSGFTQAGKPYIVMELLPGGSLEALLAERGPMPWQDGVEVGVRIGGALEAAHGAGMTHGDVTPDHLLVCSSGEPKLSPVGVAAVLERSAGRTAPDPAAIAHAAPEIFDGAAPGVASDVYGLASTVYTLIYGHAPFWRATDVSVLPIMTRIFWEPPPDLRTLGVPDAVCTVLERALAKRPGDRHPSAAAFVDALATAGGSTGEVEGPPVVPVTGAGDPPSRRRPPKVVAAAAAAVVVAVTAGALALVSGGREGDGDQARGSLVTRLADDGPADDSPAPTSPVPPTSAAPPSAASAPPPTVASEHRTRPPSSPSTTEERRVVPRPRTVTMPAPVPVPAPAPPPEPAPAPEPAPVPTVSISGPDRLVVGETAVAFTAAVSNAVTWYWVDADGNRFGDGLSTVFVDATTPGVATLTVYATNVDGAARAVTKAYTVVPG